MHIGSLGPSNYCLLRSAPPSDSIGCEDRAVEVASAKSGLYPGEFDDVRSFGVCDSMGYSDAFLDRLFTAMSQDVALQARVDRQQVALQLKRIRQMREKISQAIKKMKKMNRKKKRRRIAAKIFRWAGMVIGAVAAVAGAVFTGGSSVAGYIAVATAVVAGASGVASGGFKFAEGTAEAKRISAGIELKGAEVDKMFAKQMMKQLLSHMDELNRIDAEIGREARLILENRKISRQLALNWRN